MKGTVKFNMEGAVYGLTVEGETDMELLHRMAVLGSPPSYCNECKNTEHFKLDSNKDREANIYVNVVCKKCGAKAKLGQYKAGGYFWHNFEKYVPKVTSGGSYSGEKEDSTEEVPF